MSMDEAPRRLTDDELDGLRISLADSPEGAAIERQRRLEIAIYEAKKRGAALSSAEARAEAVEAHIGRLREALENLLGEMTVESHDERLSYEVVQITQGERQRARQALSSTPVQSAERLRALEKMFHAFRDSDPRGLEDALSALAAIERGEEK